MYLWGPEVSRSQKKYPEINRNHTKSSENIENIPLVFKFSDTPEGI